MILYVDILFTINFSMDFLGLFICSKVMKYKATKTRIILASLLGAIYGIISMFIKIKPILYFSVCILIAFAMMMLCFQEKQIGRLIVLTLMYVFVSATIGGVMSILYSFFNDFLSFVSVKNERVTYNGARTFIIIGLTALASIIFSRILIKSKDVEYVELTVELNGTRYILKGLCDSGNLLVEPFSGKSVILVSEDGSLGKEILAFDDYKMKYIPFKDVSGEGILKGISPNKVKIDGRLIDVIIATVKNKNFNGYDALVPKALV